MNSFRLVQLDRKWLDSVRLASPGALSQNLRNSYPGENVGWAWYADSYSEDGWYRLEIRIDQDIPFPDVIKARAAGFVEGNLQASHMYNYWTNYRINTYRGKGEAPSQDLYNWLDEQYGWMARKVEAATGWSRAVLRGEEVLDGTGANGGGGSGGDLDGGGGGGSNAASFSSVLGGGGDGGAGSAAAVGRSLTASGGGDNDGGDDDGGDGGGAAAESYDKRYWTLVGLVAAQFEGLTAGFWAAVTDPARNMSWHELYTLNALGDLYELNVLFPPGEESGVTEGAVEAPAEAEAGTDASAAAASWRRPRRRQYSPGHGEVGEYGYGELLDCSAIIKIDPWDGGGGGDDAEDHDTSGGSSDADGHGYDDVSGDASADRSLRTAADVRGAVLGRRGTAAAVTAAAPAGTGGASAAASRRRLQQARPLLRRRVRNFWASHNTWRSYFEMVRTWKVFDLPWAASGPLTISSSPGLLHSKDDWYTTDQFVVMETTNGIYNKALYDLIQPHCVLMWQRAQIANFGARSGSEWVDLFERYNSGTYNNQWMVLDVPRLQAGRRSGVLWVLEQVPGSTLSRDVSQVLLDQGYWASYNVPYFPEIYNLTGYPQPSIYATCPRARIFSREQARISSRSDLQALMRLNRYQEDPLSDGLPNAAIAARYDLPALPDAEGRPRNWTRRAYGAVDVKVVDTDSFRQRRTYVINGPTSDDQPAFSWSAEPLFDSVRHDGLPDTFKFGWHAYQSVMGPPVRPRPGGVQEGEAE